MTAGRWLCNQCGKRFATPDYSVETVKLPLTGIVSDDDPTLPPGQVIKYKCPSCGSDKLAGAASSSNPFMPKPARKI